MYAFVANTYSNKPSIELLNEQKRAFSILGLSYDDAITKLNRICLNRFGVTYSENNGMWSEHLVFFAALATSQLEISNILEIGTFKGETTKILADLFPNSHVDSIDLSHDEIRSIGTYAYAANELPNSTEMPINVKLKTQNSLKLILETLEYDLIWVDGNHKSPYVQIDIACAIRLIKDKGFVLCDDVYLKTPKIEKDSGAESIDTILAFKEAGIINSSFIRKRLSKKFNNKITGTKFLAVLQKQSI
jgi:predicted O-methyltransferase YrrM